MSLTLDHSARNQQQSRTSFHADGGSFGSGVRKQSQGQAAGTEIGDAVLIAKQSWRVSGVGIAERAELLVIAGEKGGARPDAGGTFDDGAIDAKAKFRHGVRFVDVPAREQLRSEVAKDSLRGSEDVAVVLAASGDVEQSKQNALRAHADGIIEISGNALAHEDGGDVRPLNLGKDGWNRLDRG